jgi:hypothetical protein
MSERVNFQIWQEEDGTVSIYADGRFIEGNFDDLDEAEVRLNEIAELEE